MSNQKWPMVPISEVIQKNRKSLSADSSKLVWNLNLDQIESDTGKIIEHIYSRIEDLGSSTYGFTKGTVLYSKLRPYLNKVVVADEDGWATTELVPLKCKENIFPQYMAHYLRSPSFLSFASATVAGAKMPRMVMDKFWEHKIPVPSIEEQKRIGTILDTADVIRTKRKEAIAKLDQLAQSVFLEMFGQPQSWEKKYKFVRMNSLGMFAKAGKSVEGENIPAKENQYGVLKVSAVTRGIFKPQENKVVKTLPESNVLFPERGDVLVTRANTRDLVAACCVVEQNYENVFLSDKIWRIHLPDTVNNYVFKFIIDTPMIHQRIISTASGTSGSMLNISQDNFFAEQIPLFPIRIQRIFAERINQIQSIKFLNDVALRKEEALFLSIQEAAFSRDL